MWIVTELSFFTMVAVALVSCAPGPHAVYQLFESQSGKFMPGTYMVQQQDGSNMVDKTTVVSKTRCLMNCMNTPTCVSSANVKKIGTGEFECITNNSDNDGNLINDTETTYWEMK